MHYTGFLVVLSKYSDIGNKAMILRREHLN